LVAALCIEPDAPVAAADQRFGEPRGVSGVAARRVFLIAFRVQKHADKSVPGKTMTRELPAQDDIDLAFWLQHSH
jgi:hypothetical protein